MHMNDPAKVIMRTEKGLFLFFVSHWGLLESLLTFVGSDVIVFPPCGLRLGHVIFFTKNRLGHGYG